MENRENDYAALLVLEAAFSLGGAPIEQIQRALAILRDKVAGSQPYLEGRGVYPMGKGVYPTGRGVYPTQPQLAAAFKARGVGGLGRSNLKNYRQIALTWPALRIRQTLSGESSALGQTWQALSVSVPALPAGGDVLAWQDDAWMLRLRRELSFSHLLELSRVNDPVARAFYEVQALAHRCG